MLAKIIFIIIIEEIHDKCAKELEYFHATQSRLSTSDKAESCRLIFMILALSAFTFREIPAIF